MITFNLERALAGDKVVMRDGREVNQLTTFYTKYNPKLCGYDVDSDMLREWATDGICGNNGTSDLFMAPRKLTGFVNVYLDTKMISPWRYATKAIADAEANVNRIACIDLSQFSEGEGLCLVT